MNNDDGSVADLQFFKENLRSSESVIRLLDITFRERKEVHVHIFRQSIQVKVKKDAEHLQ